VCFPTLGRHAQPSPGTAIWNPYPYLSIPISGYTRCYLYLCHALATGAVLSQQSPYDFKWHPVAFYSKSLNTVEWNYEICDKEMLVVMRALEEWRHFLEGAKHRVEIWTDHSIS
jgi:hypothetical protein